MGSLEKGASRVKPKSGPRGVDSSAAENCDPKHCTSDNDAGKVSPKPPGHEGNRSVENGPPAGVNTPTTIVVRDQYQPEGQGQVLEGPNSRDVLRLALDTDITGIRFPIIVVKRGPITFVDADTHDWPEKPTDRELAAFATAVYPRPDAWWITHGSGLRLVYIGIDHDSAAAAACLSLPKSFELEIKKDTRHPRGAHPKYAGRVAGRVIWTPTLWPRRLDWEQVGTPTVADVEGILSELGLEPGRRYDHDRCPIAGDEPSDAKDCVTVLDRGVFCHRCAAEEKARPGFSAGFVPFAALSGKDLPSAIARMAKNFVHWAHARIHLTHLHPNLGEKALRELYKRVVSYSRDAGDPRIPMCFNDDLRILCTPVGPVDAATFEMLKLSRDSFDAFPGVYDFFWGMEDGKKVPKLKLRAPLRDRLRNGQCLDGYVPIKLARGIVFCPLRDTIPCAVPPLAGAPVELLKGKTLIPEDEAFQDLERHFPGLNPTYLAAALTAVMCAEFGGRPPMVLAVGPTGSAKEQHLALAGSFLADLVNKLTVFPDEEKWWRQLGSGVAEGRRFPFLDEILRRPHKEMELVVKYILEISSHVSWRKYYKDANRTDPFRSAFFLASGAVPDLFRKSPELRRRIWLMRLERTVPKEWGEACGGDVSEWRARSPSHARIANSLVTHCFALAARFEYRFDRVAQHLGLEQLNEGESEYERELLRALYEHCRGGNGERLVIEKGKFEGGTWIDARSPAAWSILKDLVPDLDMTDNSDDTAQFYHLLTNLQMVSWNEKLGVDDPPIMFEGRKHHATLVMRFRDSSRQKKGRFICNENLPSIPPDSGPGGSAPDEHTDENADDGPSAPLIASAVEPVPSEPSSSVRQNGRNQDSLKSICTSRLAPSGSSSVRSVRESTQKQIGEPEEKVGADEGAKEGGSWKGGRDGRNCAVQSRNSPGAKDLQATSVRTEPRTELDGTRTDLATADPSAATDVGQILRSAGFPDTAVVIDFETYFDPRFSLKKLTVPEYVHDPRFRAHGIAVRWPDGRSEFRSDVAQCLADLAQAFGENFNRMTLVGHNLAFDAYVLSACYNVRPAYMVDTLALARHAHPDAPHDLRCSAERYNLQPKGQIGDLSGVRTLDPHQEAQLAGYAVHDAELTYQLLNILLPKLSRASVELRIIDHTVRLATERGLTLDLEASCRLKREFEVEVNAALQAAGLDRKSAGGADFVKKLASALAPDEVPMKSGKNGQIPALAKTDEGMTALLKHRNPRVTALARARLAVRSEPQFTKRLDRMIDIAESTGGIIPVTLNYYGAHTGRFSGGGGINLQNLAAHKPGPASRIRELLIPRPGYKFVVADAAQIEARVLAWIATQEDLVQLFREDVDVYSTFASSIFGAEVRKPREDDPPDKQKLLAARRQLGKRAVLGLGYGMGAKTFTKNLREVPAMAEFFDSGVLDDSRIQDIVWSYRGMYHWIPALWKDCERATYQAIEVGRANSQCLGFECASGTLFLSLPSGRRLVYPDIEFRGEEIVYGSRKAKLYGGKIVENVVQAIARDVLVDAILELEAREHTVVLHVHDEVVLEVEEKQAEAVCQTANAVFSEAPAWAPGLPLSAEAKVMDRYGK